MKSRILTPLLLLMLSLCGTQAHATIIGDSVDGSFDVIFGDWSISPSTTVVAPGGPDFQISISGGRGIDIDIEEGFIDFTYNNVTNIAIGGCNLNCSITISQINDIILGVNLLEFDMGTGGFGGNTAAFTTSSITLFADGLWDSTDRVRIEFTSDMGNVPVPASLALLGLGLAGLGWSRSRKA